jgi:hypothetical protein
VEGGGGLWSMEAVGRLGHALTDLYKCKVLNHVRSFLFTGACRVVD